MWNNAFDYIMKIKRDYISRFGILDTKSVFDMCQKLNTKEYDNFIHCVTITNYKYINLFKYSFILGGELDLKENPNSIYREMRGFAVDIEKEQIVLSPFKKFFNINEMEEVSVDIVRANIKKASIFEITNKLDGSMLSARYYNDNYILAGTGSLHLNYNNPRLDECYEWFTESYRNMAKDNPTITFIFEYISLKDQKVVKYSAKEQGLYLIGARNVVDGYTFTYREILNMANKYSIPITKLENGKLDDLLSQTESYKSTEKEGWVLRVDNNMYKLKCTDYVNIHAFLSDIVSPNVIIKNIYNNTLDDVIATLPPSYHLIMKR